MRRRPGGRQVIARHAGALIAAAAMLGLATPVARAAVTTVACDGQGDIVAVQAAVDAAASGDVIRLSGTCDFTAAAPHGGGVASIDATAVLIRPGTPVTNLTIESAGSPQSATVLGSGTQTAFAVAPGNAGVTVRGLRFVGLARPIVVIGAAGTTVGHPTGTPSPNGNRIVGHATMNSAILAVADDQPVTVDYGPGGLTGTATLTGSSLTGLRVQGNTVTYSPLGPAGPQGVADIVAVDVRQDHGGNVDGVTVSGNAVGLFTADLASFRHNAVRVEGLAPGPASNPPAATDYRIRHVAVTGNNLGRFEELGSEVAGVDPGDTHAAGRAGVVVIRAADFEVSGNRVRSRISATGPVSEPGGGIVVSDSGFGSVVDNHTIVVIADATTPETSDLGAVAVVEGVPALFGGSSADQATTRVEVARNVVAKAPDAVDPGRAIVLSGADMVTAWDNEVSQSRGPAVLIGADVRGPTGAALPRRVTRSVVCANILDGVVDNPAEIGFNPGTASSTGNAFPGGSVFASNMECTPTLAVSPGTVTSGGTLTATGLSWAARPATVTVRDESTGVLAKATTANDLGGYTVTFSSIELAALGDGRLTVTATASDPSGFTRDSPARTVRKNFVTNPPPAGTVAISDGGDGFMNIEEMLAQAVSASWSPPPGSVEAATVWWSDAGGATPAACGPFRVAPSGAVALTRPCSDLLPQGTFRFNAFWESTDGEGSPAVFASSVKDTVVVPPSITGPANGSTVNSSPVTISGATEAGATVSVTKRGLDGTFAVATTTTANQTGAWSATLALADGGHTVSAYIRDPAGNRSGSTAPVAFTVDTSPPPVPDTTPPAAPAITSPANGSVQRGSFLVFGTAEPGAAIRVYVGTTQVGQGGTDGNGSFVAGVGLPTGTWTIRANATDAAGNTSAGFSNEITLDVDASPPGLTITTPTDRIFGPLEPAVIEGTATDNRAVQYVAVRYSELGTVVATDFATCSPACPAASVTWSTQRNLAPGIYDVTVFAVDTLDNIAVKTTRIIKLP